MWQAKEITPPEITNAQCLEGREVLDQLPSVILESLISLKIWKLWNSSQNKSCTYKNLNRLLWSKCSYLIAIYCQYFISYPALLMYGALSMPMESNLFLVFSTYLRVVGTWVNSCSTGTLYVPKSMYYWLLPWQMRKLVNFQWLTTYMLPLFTFCFLLEDSNFYYSSL